MRLRNLLALALIVCTTSSLIAQKYKTTDSSVVKRTYNGIEFSSDKSLFENLSEAPGFTVYSSMLETHSEAVLQEGFMGTVFVMPDTAFDTDSEDPEAPNLSDPSLQKKILQFLIVPGRVDAHALKKAASKGGGIARLSTVSGSTLQVKLQGDQIVLLDSKGNSSQLIATDLYHREGFFHIADAILLPE
ncbi:fasciclin domain-containing protein [Aureitalea sp. L0-47]|uniref:fasciclin domain-containing protein n=1 Tax=Aureitalea sp. L0-47 TaxID=2816962 RepID=UPI002238AFC1|nr:fasciclin domain-containing protein [Aureitalea sp. L0-47]MCW5519588.1 fasciclin domain-containing protein [Aureitalea sp. L0-47]